MKRDTLFNFILKLLTDYLEYLIFPKIMQVFERDKEI